MELSKETLQSVILAGRNLSSLTQAQKAEYIIAMCEKLGLDPATRPLGIFQSYDGKKKCMVESLYADRGCASQLNESRKLSHQIISERKEDGLYIVIDRCTGPDGRFTEELGAVSLVTEDYTRDEGPSQVKDLQGTRRANAMMHARTKAMRRATLTHVGLGLLDEEEVATIPNAKKVVLEESAPEPVRPGDCNAELVTNNPNKPENEWNDEDIENAKTYVDSFSDELCLRGYSEEEIEEVFTKGSNPKTAIGSKDLTYDMWLRRWLRWADDRSKKHPAKV